MEYMFDKRLMCVTVIYFYIDLVRSYDNHVSDKQEEPLNAKIISSDMQVWK